MTGELEFITKNVSNVSNGAAFLYKFDDGAIDEC